MCLPTVIKYSECTYWRMDTLLQVSYHDVPDRAYETFVSALTSKYLERGLVIPSLVDVHNPAGTYIVNVHFRLTEKLFAKYHIHVRRNFIRRKHTSSPPAINDW